MNAVRQWDRHRRRIIVIQIQCAAPLKYHSTLTRQLFDFDFNKIVFRRNSTRYRIRVIVDSDAGTDRTVELVLLWNRLLWKRKIVKWSRLGIVFILNVLRLINFQI